MGALPLPLPILQRWLLYTHYQKRDALLNPALKVLKKVLDAMNCLRFQPMSLVLTTHIIILLLLCDVWAIALIPSRQCSSYFDGNTTTATCDDIPNYICTRGCYGPFVTSQGCQSNTGRLPLTSPLTTQVCNLGFSPHDLEGAPNACLTSNAAYLCRGAYSGTATCYNCRDTENLYSKGRSPPY